MKEIKKIQRRGFAKPSPGQVLLTISNASALAASIAAGRDFCMDS